MWKNAASDMVELQRLYVTAVEAVLAEITCMNGAVSWIFSSELDDCGADLC
jgi:hypothetical protein